jgi:RNA polymerase sigma-70 factor (ECF subfamily)
MSKDVGEKVFLELALLAALDRVDADVDTSEIAEIQDWSGAVRGKFYGASIEKPSRLTRLKAGLLSALGRPRAANTPGSSARDVRRVIPAASGNVASHGSVQYSQMAIPQLIAVCKSESSEEAWSEFVRRSQPLIRAVITKAVRRIGNVSHDLVDDLIQNVYLKLCANNFRAVRNVEILQENAFFGFLKVVATNTVQDYLRSAQALKTGGTREPELLQADLVLPERASRVASSELERKILSEKIDRILTTLSHEPNLERDRTIFWLYFRQGLPAKEIAALPDIKLSVKGVESVLHRLSRQIKAALTQEMKKPNRGL